MSDQTGGEGLDRHAESPDDEGRVTQILDRVHGFLHQVAHRPSSDTDRPWIMEQRWDNLLFCHWRVSPEALRPRIPDDLEVETFDGSAWLSLVPMRMGKIHFRLLPGIPGLDNFPEMNLRTYVTRDGVPGVWFFSLDTPSPINVWIAQQGFHLPYFEAEQGMDDQAFPIRFESRRTEPALPRAEVRVRYRPLGEGFTPAEGTLEHFLNERYAMYSLSPDGALLRGDIDHAPWVIQAAEAEVEVNTMPQAHGIPVLDAPPLFGFARSIEVLCWRPTFVRATGGEGT
jgi:uncharacterized protein YqjF (DUF2071 family)